MQEIELVVEGFWRKTLRLAEEVSLERESFFERGGTSLQAVALAAQLEARFGVELTALSILDHSTPRRLAAHIHAQQVRAGAVDGEEEGVL